MTEREVLESLLKDAEAVVSRIRARLAERLPGEDGALSASAAEAIELVQSQKTGDDTGNY